MEFTKYVCAVAIAFKEQIQNQIRSGTYFALFTFRIERKKWMRITVQVVSMQENVKWIL